jgi:hypothetical protein
VGFQDRMKEKPKNCATSNILPPLPTFVIAPPLRCHHHELGSPRVICGELATRQRKSAHWFDIRYFCERHATATDAPIAGDQFFRLVRFNLDVLLAGCSIAHNIAHTEALQRLEAAIAAAGGIVDVEWVRSTFGRYSPAPARGVPLVRRSTPE